MRIESILSKNIDAMGDKAAYDAPASACWQTK